MGPCGVCYPSPAAASPHLASPVTGRALGSSSTHASLQAEPEGHHDTVPGGIIAELKRRLTASTVPIQVMKNLPDVLVVSRAKHPPAPDERGALAGMLISWRFMVAFS